MNTERNHPRDQNSPLVQSMMDELRANAAGIDCAATYPSSEDYTFGIPAGLVPGCDDRLPNSGLMVIYIDSRLLPATFGVDPSTYADPASVYLEKLAAACKGHLHEVTSLDNLSATQEERDAARQICRQERKLAVELNRLSVMTLTLTREQRPCVLEQEADVSLYMYPGVDGIILERGKLRRAQLVEDPNMVLRLN